MVEISGAAVQHADEVYIIIIVHEGFGSLSSAVRALPQTGWIFVERGIDLGSYEALLKARFFIAEVQSEEIELERSKRTFVECPTLVDILSVLDKRKEQPGIPEYLNATIYYREYDDFQE